MRRHQGHSFNGAEGSCGVRGTGDHWKHVTTWVFKPFELSQHLHRGSCYIALMTCFPWMNLLSLSTNLVLGVHRISIRDVTLARFGDRFRSWQAFKAKPCYRVPWRSAIKLSLLAAHFCPQFLLTYESRTEAFLLHGGGWCGSLGLVLTLRRLNTLPLEPSWLPVTEFLGFAPDLQKPKSFHHFQPIDRRRPWNTASFDHSHGKKSTKGPMKRRRLPSREREAEMFQRERARSVRNHEASTEALPSGKEPKTGPKPPPYVKLRPHGATDLPNEAPAVPPPLVAYSSSDENSPGEMKQVI